MAQNHISEGNILPYTVPSSTTILSGDVVFAGVLPGIALGGGTEDDEIQLALRGVWLIDKTTSLVITKGDKLYFNTSTKKVTKTKTHKYIGIAWTSQASDDTTVEVLLNPDTNSETNQAAVVAALGTTTDLTAIAGTFADLAAARSAVNTLATETEARLDAIESKIDAFIASLKTAGLMASA